MVLEVLPDPRQVDFHLDAVALQLVGRADPGQHQEFGRDERPASQEDLTVDLGGLHLALVRVLHAHRPAVAHDDAGDVCPGAQVQVRVGHDRA